MWLTFFAAVVLAVVFVFLPGAIFFRALRFGWLSSILIAPLYSIAAYPVIGTMFGFAGITSSWMSVFSACLAFGCVAFAISLIIERAVKLSDFSILGASCGFDVCISLRFRDAALYVVVACVLVGFVFVYNLDGASSFAQTIDSTHHLGEARSFVQSGDWSSFGSSQYLENEAISPFELTSSFYPSGWHCLVALIVSALGVPVTLGANAVNTALLVAVFPCGMYFALSFMFKGERKVVLWGALAIMCFAAFPWRFIYWGVLFPNLLAYCLVVPVAIVFAIGISDLSHRFQRLKYLVAFCIGMIALVFSQTNAVFTAAVFLIPYCLYRIFETTIADKGLKGYSRRCYIGVGGFLVFVVAFWLFCFKLPFMQGVVNNTWAAVYTWPQAIVNAILLSYRETPVQLLLSLFVAFGLFVSLKERRYRWLAAAYAIASIMYIINASSDGLLKQLIGGFWYTDHNRLAANAALFAMPLAALGMSGVFDFVYRKCNICSKTTIAHNRIKNIAAPYVLACIVTAAAVFFPSYSIPGWTNVTTAFGYTQERIAAMYSASEPNVYAPDEVEFVEKALSSIPDGSLIINNPMDGSCFAYGAEGANVLYRSYFGYGDSDETLESVLIRTELNDISEKEEIRAVVDKLGAQYVLQLDSGCEYGSEKSLGEYDPRLWIGIDEINEKTEGFELIMEDGDKKLYKITE